MKLVNSIKSISLKLWKDESGQGTAEYALILVAVVAVALAFKEQILKVIGSQFDKITGALQGLTAT